jgi:hypothetical protein
MGRAGAQPEVVRDDMGHHDVEPTQNIYGKTWWEEWVDAASAAVDLFVTATEPKEREDENDAEDPRAMLFSELSSTVELEPQLEPCLADGAPGKLEVVEKIGRGERI